MKRRAEFLVEKRDGRTEWLRATKLARSIHLALQRSQIDEGWRALDVACTVLAGLRARALVGPYLTTAAIADATQQVLVAIGHRDAAAMYAAVGAERHRRRAGFARILGDRRVEARDPAAGAGGGARRE